ncbi:hypothetical protein AAFN86_07960 [Roseomonas sp. CAU 1739]|uniref:hypothetical protein n=1 Tax=Roseomonas sp. CAU 1739 TaxID=3140364 RepID=UPI00325BA834
MRRRRYVATTDGAHAGPIVADLAYSRSVHRRSALRITWRVSCCAMADIGMVHVLDRGAASALTDLLAGRPQIDFDNMPGVVPQMRDERERPLAVAGPGCPGRLTGNGARPDRTGPTTCRRNSGR